ncbi:hypothetical protein J6590_041662 [Homalodisca vitripennis]|nr:hypothetical protein J6590_041662 [Homalodisca vitripennis]
MSAYCRLYITANNYQFANRRSESFLKIAEYSGRISQSGAIVAYNPPPFDYNGTSPLGAVSSTYPHHLSSNRVLHPYLRMPVTVNIRSDIPFVHKDRWRYFVIATSEELRRHRRAKNTNRRVANKQPIDHGL